VSPSPKAEGVGSRLTVAARSEGVGTRTTVVRSKGGRVEVDGLRKRTTTACSEVGSRQRRSLGPVMRQRHAPGLGSRTAGGGGGVTVSRAIAK
jgi:hypothetical protein